MKSKSTHSLLSVRASPLAEHERVHGRVRRGGSGADVAGACTYSPFSLFLRFRKHQNQSNSENIKIKLTHSLLSMSTSPLAEHEGVHRGIG